MFNDPKPNLFARYDPLVKTRPLFTESFDDGPGGLLTVRPVWIIGDLFIINDWLGSDLRKTNWHLNQRRMAVMQHYKQILLSEWAQAFMVEQNSLPVIQFDLIPGIQTDYPSQIEFGKMDYVIHYLYKEYFRDHRIFDRCLRCFVEFAFSYPEIGNLYLRLPKTEVATHELLKTIGFEHCDLNNFFGKSINVYKLGRKGFQSQH